MSTHESDHKVLQLWVRPVKGCTPDGRTSLELKHEQGVVGDHTFGGRRHVTLVFDEDWAAACRELGRPVDPVTRRANVLLSGGDGMRYLGSRLKLGGAMVEIQGITDPCRTMDKAAAGLMQALQPNARAGLWGTVVQEGAIHLNDGLSVVT